MLLLLLWSLSSSLFPRSKGGFIIHNIPHLCKFCHYQILQIATEFYKTLLVFYQFTVFV